MITDSSSYASGPGRLEQGQYDYILVGGGLQSGLLAKAIAYRQPKCRLLMIERNARFGGNHTWSYHAADIPSAASDWAGDLAEYRWSGYRVRFPNFQRRLTIPYCSITSEAFAERLSHDVFSESSNHRLLTNTEVDSLGRHEVETNDGQQFQAKCVIDCRGASANSINHQRTGYQKFVGWEVELDQPRPDRVPLVMDVPRDQPDSFRFFYTLPFSDRRLLVEDTCFSDQPELDKDLYRQRITAYLKDRGLRWTKIREESGCLPMPFDHTGLPRPRKPSPEVPIRGGYAGGWFHAATGYSLPLAAQFAESVASVLPEEADAAITQLVTRHRRRAYFGRFLNRLLYRLVSPSTRWQIFRRFYRVLSEDSITRFYAHEFTASDASRIVFGMPPRGLTPIRFLQDFEVRLCT